MAQFVKREDLRNPNLIEKIAGAIFARELETHGMRMMGKKKQIYAAVTDVFEAIYLNFDIHDIPTEEELEDAIRS